MEEKLTPKIILGDIKKKKINTREAVELLLSLIEESEDIDIRISSINAINELSIKSERVFKILENLLISDEDPKIRSTTAKVIIKNYLKDIVSPLEWAIQNEKSTTVLKTIFNSFKEVDNKYTKILKKHLLLSVFGVLEEELSFFLELESLCEEFKEMNIDFYRNYQSLNIKDVIRGKAVYALNNSHVIALNLSGWIPKIESYRKNALPKDHKDLLSITRLPDTIGDLFYLKYLDLSNCIFLEYLPDSLTNLQDLEILKLNNCRALKRLPEKLYRLKSLQILDLSGIYHLNELPNNLGDLLNLKELKYSGNNFYFVPLSSIPENIGNLKNLEKLVINDCKNLDNLPESIGNLQNLQELNLSYCINLRSLPNSIGDLKNLEKLVINDCKNLEYLPESIGNFQNLQELELCYCVNLKSLPESIRKLKSLKKINLSGCNLIESIPEYQKKLKSVEIVQNDSSYRVRWDIF